MKTFLIKFFAVLGLIGVGFVMKYQLERITSIMRGESDESAIAAGRTEIQWDESCVGTRYTEYGRTLEDVMRGSLAFDVSMEFPKGYDYSIIRFEWELSGLHYKLSGRKVSEAPNLYKLELLSSKDSSFDNPTALNLPAKWKSPIVRSELDYALRTFVGQAETQAAHELTETVRLSLSDISSGFSHDIVIRDKKVFVWNFENGLCETQLREPVYHDLAKCGCKINPLNTSE
ncbi:hypothetical protein N9W79_01010 [bacterium]|nr:hypothetical protein [bacterium]